MKKVKVQKQDDKQKQSWSWTVILGALLTAILSVIWFLTEPGFEPLIATITSISAIILYFSLKNSRNQRKLDRIIAVFLVILTMFAVINLSTRKNLSSNSYPLEVQSEDSTFIVVGSIEGSFKVSSNFINLHIDTATLRARGPRNVSYIRAFLAYHNEQANNWAVSRYSEKVLISKNLMQEEVYAIRNTDLVIPISGVSNLEHHWISVEIGLEDDGSKTTYAHSKYELGKYIH